MGLLVIALLSAVVCTQVSPQTTTAEEVEKLKSIVADLSRQLSYQQLSVEERVRSEGSSGLKQLRQKSAAFGRPYLGYTFTGERFASIHDHSNHNDTFGMGEVIAVLNGVEFRTRHNDYKLVKPSLLTTNIHETEEIPFPDVPPAVLAKQTLSEQIEEMQEWFKAWQEQNSTVRDYRPYFKPVLSYMEGAWNVATADGSIDEPFPSDRHFLDAEDAIDLQEKIQFTSYTGRKSNKENLAFLPRVVMGVKKDGFSPLIGQWNYRILCHPIVGDVPLSQFRLENDLTGRFTQGLPLDKYGHTRSARFSLNSREGATFHGGVTFPPTFLDTLMKQIPGKDNYPGELSDDSFNAEAVDVTMRIFGNPAVQPQNAAYYNRFYKVPGRDAMGESVRRRGFSDSNLFVALNSQTSVLPMTLHHTEKDGREFTYTQRVSYAIPLEIIYLTPLHAWNPYNFQQNDRATRQGRNGKTPEKALEGVNGKNWYLTPKEFFESSISTDEDKADTALTTAFVEDINGIVREVVSSGPRIFYPEIPGVGKVRTRYPIAPVHQEGDATWKEVQALKESVLEGFVDTYFNQESTYEMSRSTTGPLHQHTITVTRGEEIAMENNHKVFATSSVEEGHSHIDMQLGLNKANGKINIRRCDGAGRTCSDGHKAWLRRIQGTI